MQVRDSLGKESMAWLRILENVLVVANISKLTRATGDQWCSTLCRCLSSLLRSKGNRSIHCFGISKPTVDASLVDKDMAILHQCAVVTLRLSLIPGIPSYSLLGVLSRAAEYLQHLEPAIHLRRVPQPVERHPDTLALPPHRAQGLHEVPAMVEPLRTWGEIVEALWRAGMSLTHDDGTHAWTMLTQRLVVWRALVGEEGSQVGEWARKEVVVALHVVTGRNLSALNVE